MRQTDADQKATTKHTLRPHPLTAIVAFALLGAILGLVIWGIEPRHASGDTFWYARIALELTGKAEDEATRAAAEFIVREEGTHDTEAWVATAETMDPRYPAIFASRPIYPISVALFLGVADLRTAMALGALLAGVVFAAAFGWFVRHVTGSMLAGIGAVVLAFALPSGQWFAFMYADGWMLALWTLVLACACRYLLEARQRYIVAALAGLAALYLTKPANGAVLVFTFVVLGLGAMLLRTSSRAHAVTLGLWCAVVGVTQLAVFAGLGLPGFDTTLQDMFTSHFTQPDVPDPLSLLLRRDLDLVQMAVAFPFREAPVFLMLVALLAPLAIARRSWATAWLLAGLASVLTVVVHPVTSEIPRLLAPIWISAALGGSWWLSRFWVSQRRRLRWTAADTRNWIP